RTHDWKTRVNPFEEDWPWVVSELERDPALTGSTLFALLCERHPDRYRPTQVRTLQRHIQRWHALHGPEREVMFAQEHFAFRTGTIGLYPHGGSRGHPCRCTFSSYGASFCADLLQCRSGEHLFQRIL